MGQSIENTHFFGCLDFEFYFENYFDIYFDIYFEIDVAVCIQKYLAFSGMVWYNKREKSRGCYGFI